MKGTTKVPRVASMLGWAGVVPFALLALSVALRQGMAPALALDALFAYAAIILAFMGGVRWGLSTASRPFAVVRRSLGLAMVSAPENAGVDSAALAISVLPALAAFGCWFLPRPTGLFGLMAAFAVLLVYDRSIRRATSAPSWYARLRTELTGAVVVCLAAAAVFSGAPRRVTAGHRCKSSGSSGICGFRTMRRCRKRPNAGPCYLLSSSNQPSGASPTPRIGNMPSHGNALSNSI